MRQLFSQKVLTESFIEYLGELLRIFLGKYTLYFPFLKSFDLLFFTVFCAKQPPGSPISQKTIANI